MEYTTTGISIPESAIRNSVFSELTRNFRATLRASKPHLEEGHPFNNACLHACIFPDDRLSLQIVWEAFEKLPVGKRIEILAELRTNTL
jgi:hypothetical protein